MATTTTIDEDEEAMRRRPIQNPVVKAKQHKTAAITLQPRKPLQDLGNSSDRNKKPRLTQFYSHSVPFKKEESERAKKLHFSDLTEEQLTAIFSGLPPFRFEFCSGFLIYKSFLADLKLFGTIQAAAGDFSPDPLLQQNCFSAVFNREFDNPVHVFAGGHDELHDLLHCSLPLSSTTSVIQILANLYVTTDQVDEKIVKVPTVLDEDDLRARELCLKHFLKACGGKDAESDKVTMLLEDDLETTCTIRETQNKKKKKNVGYQVCDDHVFINLSDIPNGGSGKNIIKGRDGSLELYYVALKYAVDAHLELEFVPPSKKSKVTGRVKAYYGKEFGYEVPDADYRVLLFETNPPNYVKPGKINLTRSVLAVPAKFSLIIEAELFDKISMEKILSGTYEFFVPLDGSPSFGSIASTDCSLKLKVNWKLPIKNEKFPSSPIYPPASNSSVRRLTERRKFGAPSTSTFADPDEDNRWSLQEEIEKVFNTSLERTFGGDHQETVSCSISTCTKEDGCDYICSSVLHMWPELRKTRLYRGPNCAGLVVKDNIMGSEYKDMIDKCVVCGPGFVKFKLSGKWIAQTIHKMLTHGIDTWAPKLSVRRASVYFFSRNLDQVMHTGHLRSTFIGETLARMLEFSSVVVFRKRNIHLDIKTLPLLHPTDFWRTLNEENVDWTVHVTEEEQRDNFKIYISAAKGAGLITNDHSKYPLSHVGFGLVQGDDFERFQVLSTKVVNLAHLLYEAKSRGRVLLVRRGMADEWTAEELEHAAESLGFGAVKYADLKNNRLSDYTFGFDQMFNEEGNTAVYLRFTHVRICSVIRDSRKDIKKLKAEELEELILKNDDERELGLHLLRFTEVLEEACAVLAPHLLCEYLYELCNKSNGLHSSAWQVFGSSEETSKLLLLEATEVVMRKGFDLLGITPVCKTV